MWDLYLAFQIGRIVVNVLLLYTLLSTYQSRFITNIIVNTNPDTTQSVFSGICLTRCSSIRNSSFTRIPKSISIQIRLSLYSQVSVLKDTTQSGTQGSHEYHNQYQSGNESVFILKVIPNLYLSIKKVIQDASRSLTKKNYSYAVIKVEYYYN